MHDTGCPFPPASSADPSPSSPSSPVGSYPEGLTPKHESPVHTDGLPANRGSQPEARAHALPAYPGASVYPPSEPPSERLNPRSCVTCRRRKVRCDKHMPCANCRRAQVTCVFPAPGRAPRRARPKDPNAPPRQPSSPRELELMQRLRTLEAIVQELSGQIEVESARNHSGSGDFPEATIAPGSDPHAYIHGAGGPLLDRADGGAAGSGQSQGSPSQAGEGRPSPYTYNSGSGILQRQESINQKFGRLVVNDHGKTKYVSSGLWSKITVELEELRNETHRLTDGESDLSDAESMIANNHSGGDHHAFIMGYRSADVDLRPLHPLPSQIPYMWRVYKENVDPIVKVLHVPTVEKLVNQVRKDLDNLTPANEALLFAIYFAAITSMDENDVKTNFGLERPKLIVQYRFALEQALAKAEFITSPELVVLQAFILFLGLVRRHDDTRFCWTLTGLAIRIGQSMGLHRDGAFLPGLTPLEIEMRRRVFWSLCSLDLRSAEEQGTDLTIVERTFDTELPLNINDSDISEEATEMPPSRHGASDMTFSLIRYEICAQARSLYVVSGATPEACSRDTAVSLEERESMVRNIYQGVEEKYFKDQSVSVDPMLWTAANIARLITAKMTLVVYQPMLFPGPDGVVLSEEIRTRIFTAATEIFEYSHQLNSDQRSKQWKWLFQTYTQWHAVAYVLMEVAHRPWGPSVERAWAALNSIFSQPHQDDVNRILGDQAVWLPLRRIYMKAKKHREAEITRLKNDADAAQQLEIEDRNKAPVPLSFTAMPGSVKSAMATERWRKLVNAPPLPPQQQQNPPSNNPCDQLTQKTFHQEGLPSISTGASNGMATGGLPDARAMSLVEDTINASHFLPEYLWPIAFTPEYQGLARTSTAVGAAGGFPVMGSSTSGMPRQDATMDGSGGGGGGSGGGGGAAGHTAARMKATPLLDARRIEGSLPVWMWSDVTGADYLTGGAPAGGSAISAGLPAVRPSFQFPLGGPSGSGDGLPPEDIDMDVNEDFNWADWGQNLMEQAGRTGGVWSAHGI